MGAEGATESDAPLVIVGDLLQRPLPDALREITASMSLHSTSHAAVEQLVCLLAHNSSAASAVSASPVLLSLLASFVRESPALPLAGSAMKALARLSLMPSGRAVLNAECLVPPLVRFLSLPGNLAKPTSEAALLLLQNLCNDGVARSAATKAGAVPALVQLLAQHAEWLKQRPALSGCLAGTLCNLVVADPQGHLAKQRFVKAGGVEAACKALAQWGRHDTQAAVLRLRLLLSEVSRACGGQLAQHVQQCALDASTMSARGMLQFNDAAGHCAFPAGSRTDEAAGQGPGQGLGAARPPGVGVVLGAPHMPASERITAAVLLHGRANGDDTNEEQGGGGQAS